MTYFDSRVICQTLLLLSLLALPATATQVWVGTGRVVEGVGQGGTVKLQLETEREVLTDGDLVKSLHGPALNGRIQAGMIRNNFGSWHFEQCSQNLCVILMRNNPRQTIIYRLHRSAPGRTE